MLLQIAGISYQAAADVAREAGISRQTLWRWRQEGKVPVGRRFRDGRILFTVDEVAEIRRFASELQPVELRNFQAGRYIARNCSAPRVDDEVGP